MIFNEKLSLNTILKEISIEESHKIFFLPCASNIFSKNKENLQSEWIVGWNPKCSQTDIRKGGEWVCIQQRDKYYHFKIWIDSWEKNR